MNARFAASATLCFRDVGGINLGPDTPSPTLGFQAPSAKEGENSSKNDSTQSKLVPAVAASSSIIREVEQLAKKVSEEMQSSPVAESKPEPHKTILDSVINWLSFAPSLQKVFKAYAHDEKLKDTDKSGIKTKISLASNQLSVFSNLVSLVLPNSKAFEGINKVVDIFGQYAYRAMIGISAFAKFTKVSKNNDLIASVMSFAKTIFALNAQNVLALPFKLFGIKAKFNLPFENFYSWLGATNGPMNISSAAANAMMSKEGFKTAGESLSAFKQQWIDTAKTFKEKGLVQALNPKEGVGVHGTLGGTLQFIGFLMKQTGLAIKSKHAVLGEALAHSGSILRNQIACVLTDIERFSPEKMEKGKIESVASGVNYTIEGVLDEAQQIPFVQEKAGKQIRALMGLFGTWAAATNAEGVHEERKDFHGTPLMQGESSIPKYLKAMVEAMLKANAGHSVPKSFLPKAWFGSHSTESKPIALSAPAPAEQKPSSTQAVVTTALNAANDETILASEQVKKAA